VPIDTKGSVIDGIAAVAFWPALEGRVPSDPRGCTVHLVPEPDPDREIVQPCGTWFLLARERTKYAWWLEGPGWISPRTLVMHYAQVPAEGRESRAAVAPVVAAGVVFLPGETRTPAKWSLRLLSADGVFQRRVRPEQALAGVAMPAGRVLAAIHDDDTGEYTALGRPTLLTANGRVAVTPRPPAPPNTDVLVVLERPRLVAPDADEVAGAFVTPGARIRPDVVVRHPERVFLFWFALAEKAGRVEVTSASVWAKPPELRLRPGAVEVQEARLRVKPSLRVSVLLPSVLADKPVTVSVEAFDNPMSIAERTLGRDETAVELRALPPDRLHLVVHAGSWEFLQEVDLSGGDDMEVSVEPKPLYVRGTVTRGNEGTPATVRFRAGRGDQWAEAVADSAGRYEIALFKPGRYFIEVLAPGAAGPFFLMPLAKVDADRELDIRLPVGTVRVTVRDAETRLPVPGAAITVTNAASDGVKTVDSVHGDERGQASLPPQRPGTFALHVSADAYEDSDIAAQSVPETEDVREVEVALRARRDSLKVDVWLPDGTPAGGAAAWLTAAPESVPEFTGACDAAGHCIVPRKVGLLLFVRHPQAGFAVAPLTEPPGDRSLQVQLTPSAPPLVVHAIKSSGEGAAFARVAVWVGELRLSGPLLQWLTGAPPAASREGFWHASNLPAGPIAVLAWSPGSGLEGAIAGGAFDSQRVPVVYPWAGAVFVTTL
jgi:hypothetical protein